MAKVTASGTNLEELLHADIEIDFNGSHRFAGLVMAPGAELSLIIADGVAITLKGKPLERYHE